MEAPASAIQIAQFEAWLKADPAHLQAYRDAEGIADLGIRLESVPAAVPVASNGRFAGAVMALGALISVAAGTWWAVQERSPAYTAIVNRSPAVRAFDLNNGARMIVDSATAVEVATGEASVRLTKGRARFFVQRPAAQPLRLTTAAGTLSVASGILDLMADGRALRVCLLGGEATWRAADAAPAIRLAGTARLRIDDKGHRTAETGAFDTLWPEARVAFDAVPLSAVLARANRGRGPKLMADDPSIAALQVTGVLDLRDPRRLAGKLAAALGLGVEVRSDALVLRRKK